MSLTVQLDAFDPVNATYGTETDASPTIRHVRMSGSEFSGKTSLFKGLLNSIGTHLFALKTSSLDEDLQVVVSITEAYSTDARGLTTHCRDLGHGVIDNSPREISIKEDPTVYSVEYDDSKLTRLLIITERGWKRVLKKVFGEPFKAGGVTIREGVATAVHVTIQIVSGLFLCAG